MNIMYDDAIVTNLRVIMMQILLRRDPKAYWREKWEQYKDFAGNSAQLNKNNPRTGGQRGVPEIDIQKSRNQQRRKEIQ